MTFQLWMARERLMVIFLTAFRIIGPVSNSNNWKMIWRLVYELASE